MKILYITGDDYAALDFEKRYKINTVYQKLVEENIDSITLEEGIEVSLLEFETVDPNFIEFIKKELLDYDFQKTTNFYVVNENATN